MNRFCCHIHIHIFDFLLKAIKDPIRRAEYPVCDAMLWSICNDDKGSWLSL